MTIRFEKWDDTMYGIMFFPTYFAVGFYKWTVEISWEKK